MIDNIPNIKNTGSNNFFLIAGPCVVENEEMVFTIAEKVFEPEKFKSRLASQETG